MGCPLDGSGAEHPHDLPCETERYILCGCISQREGYLNLLAKGALAESLVTSRQEEYVSMEAQGLREEWDEKKMAIGMGSPCWECVWST